ncbi:hypothetical protein INT45_003779 [Circinella minor]|uniref:Uncharacterized protein n=1 Tax=Circinella minor TaxID=1195481 RepID=A0A8H7VGK1_9FUNG|nr:hypothetical protein INT45_003779 [Circinella minor]
MIRSTRYLASQATTALTSIANPTSNVRRIRLVVNPPTPILTSSPISTSPPTSEHVFAIPAPVRRTVDHWTAIGNAHAFASRYLCLVTDDILVCLHTPADLNVLSQHLNTYKLASNPKFDRSKTRTISLSGQPSPRWNLALQEHGFTACYDRTHSDALIYLGFPLYSASG